MTIDRCHNWERWRTTDLASKSYVWGQFVKPSKLISNSWTQVDHCCSQHNSDDNKCALSQDIRFLTFGNSLTGYRNRSIVLWRSILDMWYYVIEDVTQAQYECPWKTPKMNRTYVNLILSLHLLCCFHWCLKIFGILFLFQKKEEFGSDRPLSIAHVSCSESSSSQGRHSYYSEPLANTYSILEQRTLALLMEGSGSVPNISPQTSQAKREKGVVVNVEKTVGRNIRHGSSVNSKTRNI